LALKGLIEKIRYSHFLRLGIAAIEN
jgi:hypothetical protein